MTWIYTVENAYALSAGISREIPYRDRRLTEFMLTIPAWELFNGKRKKYLAYRAMKGIFPESVLNHRGSAAMVPLLDRGLLERERAVTERLVGKTDTLWHKYVRVNTILEILHQSTLRADTTAEMISWLCLSLDLWHENQMQL